MAKRLIITTAGGRAVGMAMEVSGWNVRRGTWTIQTAMDFIETVNEQKPERRMELVADWHDFMIRTKAESAALLATV